MFVIDFFKVVLQKPDLINSRIFVGTFIPHDCRGLLRAQLDLWIFLAFALRQAVLGADLSPLLRADGLGVVLSHHLPLLHTGNLERRVDLVLFVNVFIEQGTGADDNVLFYCLGIVEFPAGARRLLLLLHVILDLALLAVSCLLLLQFLLDLPRVGNVHYTVVAARFG